MSQQKGSRTDINKWFCAIADAYGSGNAPWAYSRGRSVAVRIWSLFNAKYGEVEADEAVRRCAKKHNIYPGKKPK